MFSGNAHEFNALDELFVEQLEDLYDAEQRWVKMLPKLSDAATDEQLVGDLSSELDRVKGRIERLENTFEKLDRNSNREPCEAMKGLVKEGNKMVEATGDPRVRDVGLIATVRRISHYELAGYESVHGIARQLGHHDVADSLQCSADEVVDAIGAMGTIAESWINFQASAN